MEMFPNSQIIAVFDHPEASFRATIWPSYKGNRPEVPQVRILRGLKEAKSRGLMIRLFVISSLMILFFVFYSLMILFFVFSSLMIRFFVFTPNDADMHSRLAHGADLDAQELKSQFDIVKVPFP